MIEDEYPLTPLQQAMLLEYGSGRDPAADVMQLVCRIAEPIDVPAFGEAWRALVRRHAVFRTSFHWDGDAAVQRVHDEVALPIERLDWRRPPAGGEATAFERLLREARGRGFDLARAPAMRVTIVEHGPARITRASHHHILRDGGSTARLLGELFTRYEDACYGTVTTLPEPPRFATFARWMAGRDWSRSQAYWADMMRGLRRPTTLPPRVPGDPAEADAATPAPGRGRESLALDRADTDAVRETAARLGVTPNTLLTAAWALVLSRWTGDRDVVFGVTRSCRHGSVDGASEMVGLLINTVPLRLTVPETSSVQTWLGEVRAMWTGMRPHEHTPLARIREWTAFDGDQRLFESVVVFNRSLTAVMREAGDPPSRTYEVVGETRLPLVLTAYLDADLTLQLGYDRARFAGATVTAMLAEVRTALRRMTADPARLVGTLDVLPEDERHLLLEAWNDTARALAGPPTIHGLVASHAAAAPDRPAVICGDRTLTYGAFDERANRLAHHMVALGVAHESIVAVHLPRGIDWAVAALAVLKAGGAFLLLDPALPPARLAFQLTHSGARVVITDDAHGGAVSGEGVAVVSVDDDRLRTGIDRTPATPPASEAGGASPAYLVYTSGSTGEPKGVINLHRGLRNRLLADRDDLGLGPGDHGLSKTSQAFDVAVVELFRPLVCGAAAVLAEPAAERDTDRLVALMARHDVTHASFVPSMLATIVEHPGLEDCRALRHVMVGGEVLPPAVRAAFHRRTRARLHNVYGPAEAASAVCRWTSTGSEVPGERVPIGRPFANTRLYVLDPVGRPVPIGAPGELHIGGIQVGRGYHGDPALTAGRFVADPWSTDPTARLYRTGDLVRYRLDGQLDFLGRRDRQVKVRGVRIELEEIEATLARAPQVTGAAVAPVPRPGGDDRLVAWVTGPASLDPAALRGFLRARLPIEMVPGHVVRLDRLPLTASGKVDRGALPAPPPDAGGARGHAATPRDAVEAAVLAAWETVLGQPVGDLDASFFEVGGHSLLAMRVINRLRRDLAIDVTLDAFLADPTVAGVARAVSAARDARPGGPGEVA